jgi:methyl halide transferase
MDILNAQYWDSKYNDGQTGWDIGYSNPAITSFFEQFTNKEASILIPGCGNAYEGESLHKLGFNNVTLLDYANSSKLNFMNRVKEFDANNFVLENFFEHAGSYDFIVEQTFFCALTPNLRESYVNHMHSLLAPGGKLIGVLFNIPLFEDHPPFGGHKDEYLKLFQSKFDILNMEVSEKSIPSRHGNELFIELVKI